MSSKFVTKVSKLISYLFIPPVLNLLIFIVFSFNFEYSPSNYYGIVISFIFGLFLPLVVIINFRKKGIISNNDATIKEERHLPYLFAIGFSLTGLTLTSLLGLNENITMLWMIYLLSSIIIINVNHTWKMSAHTMGASIPLGALFYLNNNNLIIVFSILLILVTFARLVLKVHTFLQVLAGIIVGFTTSLVLLKYCLYY